MRQLLVEADKKFKITIPDDAKVTFGPWSPPNNAKVEQVSWHNSGKSRGTLRIYQGSKDNIIGVFSNVTSFRDLSLGYAEEVAREEGAILWKDDEHGYVRENKHSMKKEWIQEPKFLKKGKKS